MALFQHVPVQLSGRVVGIGFNAVWDMHTNRVHRASRLYYTYFGLMCCQAPLLKFQQHEKMTPPPIHPNFFFYPLPFPQGMRSLSAGPRFANQSVSGSNYLFSQIILCRAPWTASKRPSSCAPTPKVFRDWLALIASMVYTVVLLLFFFFFHQN